MLRLALNISGNNSLATARSPIYTPLAFLPPVCMKSGVPIFAIAMLFAPLNLTAFAQVVENPQAICGNRLSGIEKAKCLVERRNAILRQLGRLPPASSSSASSSVSSESSSSSAIAAGASSSSSAQPRSCSRMNGREKALCLVEQRKEILKQLAGRPPVASIVQVPVPKAPAKSNCTRMRTPEERMKCHAGNRPGTVSSSSASASQ